MRYAKNRKKKTGAINTHEVMNTQVVNIQDTNNLVTLNNCKKRITQGVNNQIDQKGNKKTISLESEYFVNEREKEQKEIVNYIISFINKENINNIIHIYGTPGSGKTFTIKNTLSYFKETLKKEKIESIYFNVTDKKENIFKIIANRKNRLILVIDEIDMIHKNKFYDLFDTIYDTKNKEKNIFLFIISNTFLLNKFKGNKNNIKINKLISRIGDVSIKFTPYTFTDLENKCNNKYVARYLSTYGDMRKVNEINKLIKDNEILTPIESVQLVKNTFKQLCKIVEVSLHEKNILLFFYASKNHADGLDFMDFFAFCKLRNLENLDYFNFELLLENLIKKGFLNKKLQLNFLKEELKNILNE